ncbi:MAG: glucose-6-phosphate dehydrogenase assembly protein OpcA [Nocardioidaceae bacterium]
MADEGYWSAEDTTPAACEAALRQLLVEQHARSAAYVPARVLNLVVVLDHEWRGEVLNRLERVGRYHASRTILCCVNPGRSTIDAVITVSSEGEPKPGEFAETHERVVLELGEEHLAGLDTIVDPLLAMDLATVCWSPHGHRIDRMVGRAQVFLLDSVAEPDPAAAVDRAGELSERGYVVDLAWLRSTPWRERIAASFDPPEWRAELDRIGAVTVRHHPDSAVAGLLFLGWLAARLGWEPRPLAAEDGVLRGSARAAGREVRLALERDAHQSVPGLSGVTVETAAGVSLALDRGPGGLHARRRARNGRESAWTVLGASRGEPGVLGEGIRQALLRDPTYRPALGAAAGLLP